MTYGPIIIADGDILDLDAVMRVMEDSFDPAYGEGWTAPQCAGLLAMPGVWLSLAKDGSRVVGFALSRVVLKEAELLLLAVSRDCQGRGTGRLLVDDFIARAANRGAEELHLEVRDGNPAVKLYNSRGFAEVGRRRKYYTGGDGQIYDAITLSKKVAT
ncbi:MAG TPA: ribosomal protein S18-alanine N-acetyltransferase [Allosphingosinicella sp.]|nr:ribosomal protein S18-alanine N-acetyltransferase [Allosphingosinicella sp.]